MVSSCLRFFLCFGVVLGHRGGAGVPVPGLGPGPPTGASAPHPVPQTSQCQDLQSRVNHPPPDSGSHWAWGSRIALRGALCSPQLSYAVSPPSLRRGTPPTPTPRVLTQVRKQMCRVPEKVVPEGPSSLPGGEESGCGEPWELAFQAGAGHGGRGGRSGGLCVDGAVSQVPGIKQ